MRYRITTVLIFFCAVILHIAFADNTPMWVSGSFVNVRAKPESNAQVLTRLQPATYEDCMNDLAVDRIERFSAIAQQYGFT